MSKVEQTARLVQRIASAGAKRKPLPWSETIDVQRQACIAVAKWHLRKMREKKGPQ